MKRLLGILIAVGLLLLSSYVFAVTLTNGEGEPIMLISDQQTPRILVFVLGFLGVVGGMTVSLALLTDSSSGSSQFLQSPKD